MVLFSFPKIWSSKPSTSEFEKQLADLQKQIAACERQITQLRSRQRRFSGLFLFYFTLLYLIYVLSVWLVNYGNLRSINWRHPVAIISSPFIIYIGRRLIDWWYTSGLERRYERLTDLHSRQQTKVGQLKQATGFDVTQSLLQRYGGDPKIGGVDSSSGTAPSTPSQKKQKSSPQRRRNESSSALPIEGQQVPPGQPIVPIIVAEPQQQPPSNRWYDRVLDLLVGEDETAPQNRFALICWRCRHHNGLAPPGTPASEVEYQCPACGVWNPQARAAATEAKIKADAETKVKVHDESKSENEAISDNNDKIVKDNEKSELKDKDNANPT